MLVYRDNAYNVVLLLHILSVVVAFAPGGVDPMLRQLTAGEDAGVRGRLAGFMLENRRRVQSPALGLAGVFGIALVIMSDKVHEFEDTWITIAIVVWFAMNGVLHGMIFPAERKLSAGDESAASRVQAGDGILSLLFVLMLYIMVFQVRP